MCLERYGTENVLRDVVDGCVEQIRSIPGHNMSLGRISRRNRWFSVGRWDMVSGQRMYVRTLMMSLGFRACSVSLEERNSTAEMVGL